MQSASNSTNSSSNAKALPMTKIRSRTLFSIKGRPTCQRIRKIVEAFSMNMLAAICFLIYIFPGEERDKEDRFSPQESHLVS